MNKLNLQSKKLWGIILSAVIVVLIICGVWYHHYQQNNINGSYYFLERGDYDNVNNDVKKANFENGRFKENYPEVQIKRNNEFLINGKSQTLSVNKENHTMVKNGESASYVYDNKTGKLLIAFNDYDDPNNRTTLLLAKRNKSLYKEATKYHQAYLKGDKAVKSGKLNGNWKLDSVNKSALKDDNGTTDGYFTKLSLDGNHASFTVKGASKNVENYHNGNHQNQKVVFDDIYNGHIGILIKGSGGPRSYNAVYKNNKLYFSHVSDSPTEFVMSRN